MFPTTDHSTDTRKSYGHDHHFDHVVQFYTEDGPFLDELSRSVGAALGAGDSAVVIATRAHLEGLTRRLRACGLDTAKMIEAGRYVPLDARETLSEFMLEGWPDPARFREVVGPVIERAKLAAEGDIPHVFAFGEMVALLWAEGKSRLCSPVGTALERPCPGRTFFLCNARTP